MFTIVYNFQSMTEPEQVCNIFIHVPPGFLCPLRSTRFFFGNIA